MAFFYAATRLGNGIEMFSLINYNYELSHSFQSRTVIESGLAQTVTACKLNDGFVLSPKPHTSFTQRLMRHRSKLDALKCYFSSWKKKKNKCGGYCGLEHIQGIKFVHMDNTE